VEDKAGREAQYKPVDVCKHIQICCVTCQGMHVITIANWSKTAGDNVVLATAKKCNHCSFLVGSFGYQHDCPITYSKMED
jgi:hypothetical protein